jgi:5'-deoxynucleotidase YfbR-like HD superfamily hydrolase
MTNKNSQFHPVEAATDGLFNAGSGVKIDLVNPDIGTIQILDIANALSLICRFGGHLSRFYSVAQHSVLVAALAPKELKKEALLHDAPEAYVGDVIKPLKHLIGEPYAAIERRFEKLINRKFGLDTQKLIAIKKYDIEALKLEHKALQIGDAGEIMAVMQNSGMIIGGTEIFYRPLIAKIKFLEEFNKLFSNHSISKDQIWQELIASNKF